MHGMDKLFQRLKEVERSSDAKEQTLRRIRTSRTRKRRILLPSFVTAILVATAAFFILINLEKEVAPDSSGITLAQIDESFIMYSVKIDLFDPELVNHLGKIEIKDNLLWHTHVRGILETMRETDLLLEGMSLYDLGVLSEGQLHRFKIWKTDEGLYIKDFDSGLNYVNNSEESKDLLAMAEDLLSELRNPIIDSEEEEIPDMDEENEIPENNEEIEKVATLNINSEQFKERFNDEQHEVSIKIGDIVKSADGHRLQYHFYHEKNNNAVWDNLEMMSENDPAQNELKTISIYGEGLKHDRHNLFYFINIIYDAFELPIELEEFIALTGLYPIEEVENVDEHFEVAGFTFISKVSEEEKYFTIKPSNSEE